MNYLLDTCVLSEFSRRQPDPRVMKWAAEMDENKLFLSAITLGEIRRGIEKLPDSRRKTDLSLWLNEDLLERFAKKVLPIDLGTMLIWGGLTARLEQQGKPLPVFDSLIAATALQHTLVLVTRNTSDFEMTGIQMINPWN